MQVATSRAVEVHQLSRSRDSGGTILPLSDPMLHQLLKSSLALEIDASGGLASRGRSMCVRACVCWGRGWGCQPAPMLHQLPAGALEIDASDGCFLYFFSV